MHYNWNYIYMVILIMRIIMWQYFRIKANFYEIKYLAIEYLPVLHNCSGLIMCF